MVSLYGSDALYWASMATVIDLLRGIGEHAAPDGDQALRGPVALPERSSRTVSVAIPPALATTWQAASGRSLETAHAVALAAAQAGEPIAIMAHGQAPQQDLLLVALARLLATNASRALWIVPDRANAERAVPLLRATVGALDVSWQIVPAVSARVTPSRLVVATLDDLHQHLLPYGARAWQWFWTHLELLVMTDLHRLDAGSFQHLAWLARRAERLSPSEMRLFAGFSPCVEPGQILKSVFGRDFRVIDAEPARGPALVAIWHCADRRAAVTQLAGALLDRRLAITVLGRDASETQRLSATLADIPGLVVGLDTKDARIAIVYGVPRHGAERAALVRSGYRLIIFVAGDEPHEMLLAAQPELALDGVVSVPNAAEDAGVVNQHLQWAADELPLTMSEVARWRVAPVVEHLIARCLLRPMPDGRLQPGVAGAELPRSPLENVGDDPQVEISDPPSDLTAPVLPVTPSALPDRELIEDVPWAPTVASAEVSLPADDVVWTVGVDPDDVEEIIWGTLDPMPVNSPTEVAQEEHLLEALLEEPPLAPTMAPPGPMPVPPALDVESMIARMRRLREQRESEQAAPPTSSGPATVATTTEQLRFRTGQPVRAMPYGAGIVRDSRLVDGREQLTVRFPDAGDITLDPAVSVVRALDEPKPMSGGDDQDASEGT